jgi:hypothetical protein
MILGDSGHQVIGGPGWRLASGEPRKTSLRWTEGGKMAPATERLWPFDLVLRRALFVVSDGVSYGLAPRPRGGVATVDAPLSRLGLTKASGTETEARAGCWELGDAGATRS